jgi:hypothetical protein
MVRPDRELYGWVDTTIGGERASYSILAATTYRRAVLLVRTVEAIVLAPIRPDMLPEEFVAQLPPVPPARGEAVTAPYDDFAATTVKPRSSPGSARSPTRMSHALQEIFARPRTGAGNLYAARRTQSGTRVRIENPINYIDTADGRWLAFRDARNGQCLATATPATAHLIAARLNF